MIKTNCCICNAVLLRKPSRIRPRNACKPCIPQYRSRYGNLSGLTKGHGWNKGINHLSPEVIEKIRIQRMGNSTITDEGRKRISEAGKGNQYWKLVDSANRPRGENHPSWRGGVTGWKKKIYDSAEYKRWRKAVFEKDSYRCMDCGILGGELQADHIYPFIFFPRLRFDINNGQTLCVECHHKTPTFGWKVHKWKTQHFPMVQEPLKIN